MISDVFNNLLLAARFGLFDTFFISKAYFCCSLPCKRAVDALLFSNFRFRFSFLRNFNRKISRLGCEEEKRLFHIFLEKMFFTTLFMVPLDRTILYCNSLISSILFHLSVLLKCFFGVFISHRCWRGVQIIRRKNQATSVFCLASFLYTNLHE